MRQKADIATAYCPQTPQYILFVRNNQQRGLIAENAQATAPTRASRLPALQDGLRGPYLMLRPRHRRVDFSDIA
jgi:hypothetical protein